MGRLELAVLQIYIRWLIPVTTIVSSRPVAACGPEKDKARGGFPLRAHHAH